MVGPGQQRWARVVVAGLVLGGCTGERTPSAAPSPVPSSRIPSPPAVALPELSRDAQTLVLARGDRSSHVRSQVGLAGTVELVAEIACHGSGALEVVAELDRGPLVVPPVSCSGGQVQALALGRAVGPTTLTVTFAGSDVQYVARVQGVAVA